MKRAVSFILVFVLLFVAALPVLATDTDVIINEFQLQPDGASQWVELYNKGEEAIDIGSWTISDSADHSFSIPSTQLMPHQCISFASSSYHFNYASADSVILKKNGTQIDRHDYDKG